MSLADDLTRLDERHRGGALSTEEFAKAKAALLSAVPDVSGTPAAAPARAAVGAATGAPSRDPAREAGDTPPWAMYVHLSMLAGLFVPVAGFLLPFLRWQTTRDRLPGVDVHGRIVVNWILSVVIYGIVFGALAFVIVGIPLLVALGVAMIVFPVLGGLKARDGEAWRYPGSFRFLREPS